MSNLAGKASVFGSGSNSPSNMIIIRDNLGLISSRDIQKETYQLNDLKGEINSAKRILKCVKDNLSKFQETHRQDYREI